jgi:hypothetical protein
MLSDCKDDDAFCDFVLVKPPHNSAHASVIVSPAHAAVNKTTFASDLSSARNENVGGGCQQRL